VLSGRFSSCLDVGGELEHIARRRLIRVGGEELAR
jgi:hypothetical protein